MPGVGGGLAVCQLSAFASHSRHPVTSSSLPLKNIRRHSLGIHYQEFHTFQLLNAERSQAETPPHPSVCDEISPTRYKQERLIGDLHEPSMSAE